MTLSEHKDDHQLYEKYERQSQNKIPVFCFVVKQTHTQYGANGAAQDSRKKQRAFRDPPVFAFSALFIWKHEQKSQDIHAQKNIGISFIVYFLAQGYFDEEYRYFSASFAGPDPKAEASFSESIALTLSRFTKVPFL